MSYPYENSLSCTLAFLTSLVNLEPLHFLVHSGFPWYRLSLSHSSFRYNLFSTKSALVLATSTSTESHH